MSLSASMTTAVAGLDAQSRALGAISDNIANAQTTGYKRIETSFRTLLSVSNASVHEPGGVVATPVRTNDIQGSIEQVSTETNLAISGDGMFAVSRVSGVGSGGLPSFEADPIYTRAGDFNVDQNGYLVNAAGYYLNAWPVDAATGAADKNALAPVRIAQYASNPQATQSIAYSANLPVSPDATLDTDSTTADIELPPTAVNFYDALGQQHALNLAWTKVDGTNDEWKATFSTDESGASIGAPAGSVTVAFNIADDPSTGAQAGSIKSIDGVAGAIGADGTIPLTIDFAGPAASSVSMSFNLGKFGVADQTTMFTGSDIDFRGVQQDGLPPGSFRNLEIGANGQLIINYDNGARRTIGQIPIAQFSNYDGLKLENGNAYSVTGASGSPDLSLPGTNGAGSFVASALEGSNVDIAAEFTKMIQTQRAYSANARVITVTSQLLDETNNMIR
jgi:flagellar hook protein FlgE